ncbi:hypothetical protein EAL2_c20640 [Peptoclostridium acidaminophilum DSM 3953]|uniref:Uncharacterized protein n=1 Tax=Peptoclostridium acidaminophilum DSM 3953 TaxID=1286171 RepID=W8T8X5_PEPAC|nr:hypothetical protein EAL2_c20640 [Peptoclostridium acidaminophilum DSM 3953]
MQNEIQECLHTSASARRKIIKSRLLKYQDAICEVDVSGDIS